MTSNIPAKSILILAANPKGTAQLDLDQEVREIGNRLQRSKNNSQFSLHHRLTACADDLRHALLDVEPQIVHFCGHGAGEEGLAFENEAGQIQLVSAAALAGLFELFSEQVECVLLNACYSEVQAAAISQHINYVIGMRQAIQDRAALKFAIGFYDALGAGKSVEIAYKFGCSAIQLEGIAQHLVPVLKQKFAADMAIAPVLPSRPPGSALGKPAVEVFFAYSHKDEEFRDQLVSHLSNLKRQAVIQNWCDRQIVAGTEWSGEIDLRLNKADVILLLVSADFLASDYCWDIEVKQAMQRHQVGEACVLPILLRPVDWQGTPFSKLQPLPRDAKPITRWSDRDEAFVDIVEGLRAVVNELTSKRTQESNSRIEQASVRSFSTAPAEPPRYENLPRSGVVEFVGRTQELTDLHQQLHQSHQTAIMAISGMGGVGKTELALQYARQHLADYAGGVCYLSARTAEIGPQILDFAHLYFNLNPPDTMNLLQQVAFCWQHWIAGKVLVILDDVTDYEQVKPYLPPSASRFQVLLTTRLQLGISIRQLTLEVLQPEIALSLLRSLVGENRIQQEQLVAEQLCDALGYLPLGLELVGRYLARKPDLSLAKMQQRLAEKGLSDRATQTADEDMTARLGVEAAFNLSWETMSQEAKELGCLLSLFAPEPIPWTLVERCFPEQDLDDLEDLRDDCLVNLHLLQRQQEGIYQLNRLVRRYLKKQHGCSDKAVELSQQFCQAMAAMAGQIPEDPTRDLIMALRPAIPHIIEAATTLSASLSDEDFIKPFAGLGRFYRGQGFYDQAEVWYKRCRETAEQRFGSAHSVVATSLNNLGSIYRIQGRYPETELLYQQALTMRQRLLGTEHPDVADSLNNLAMLYKARGRYAEAEPLYMQALTMRQQLLGTEHPDVADSLNNLANLYKTQGRYTEAEPLYLQALAMRRQLLGIDHPRVATSLNNLASFYTVQKRYTEAELLYVQALELYRRLLGEEHPDLGTGLNNLADLYDAQQRYAEAEPLLKQALELNKRLLGTQHPIIATGLNNLAAVYDIQGRHAEAEPLYLQALEMRQQLLGMEHHLVAISLNNLAKSYYLQKRYREAKPLYKRSLAILEKRLGEAHPITVKVRSNQELLPLATKKSKAPKA